MVDDRRVRAAPQRFVHERFCGDVVAAIGLDLRKAPDAVTPVRTLRIVAVYAREILRRDVDISAFVFVRTQIIEGAVRVGEVVASARGEAEVLHRVVAAPDRIGQHSEIIRRDSRLLRRRRVRKYVFARHLRFGTLAKFEERNGA